MTDTPKATFTNARNELNESHPSWSSDRVDRLSRIYTAVEHQLYKPFLKSFPISQKLRKFCESTGLQIHESGQISNLMVEYDAPPPTIVESEESDDNGSDFNEAIIKGTAIYPTKSLNNNRYYKKEIVQAAKTLRNKPIQKNHDYSVEATFGTITKEILNESTGRLEYHGRVDADDPVTGKIERGYVKNSSVGLRAEFIECSICNEKMSFWHEHIPGFEYDGKVAEAVPRNFRFNHIGIVSFPGISGATAKIESEVVEHDNMHETVQETYLDLLTEAFMPLEQQINESLIEESSMSVNDEQKFKTELENEKLRLKLEAAEKKTKEMEAKHNQLLETAETEKRLGLTKNIAQAEIKLEKLKEDGIPVRTDELNKLSIPHLEARLEALQDVISMLPPDEALKAPARPRSRTFGEIGQDEPNPQLQGRELREMQIEWLGKRVFSKFKPSWSAVETLDNWDFKRQEWKRAIKEFLI